MNDPGLQNAPLKLAAKVTALLQEHLKNSGSAMDASVIAENVQESIVAAGTKIELMRFFDDIKKKLADGTAGMGDIAAIFEGRHFARMQAILSADLNALKQDIEANAQGYAQSTYGKYLEGIVGPVYQLSAALEKLAVAFGRANFGWMAEKIAGLADGIDRLSQSNPDLLRFATYAGLATIALIPLGMAISSLTAVAGIAVGAIGLLASGGLIALGALFTPVGAAIALAAAAMAAFGYAIYENWPAIRDFATNIGSGIAEWARGSAEGLGRMVTAFHEWTSQIDAQIQSLQRGMYEAGVNAISQLWAGMQAKVGELISWASGIGARIKGALGFGGGGDGAGATDPMGAPGGGAAPAARAAGGRVSRGSAYLVGEHRPEIFSPRQDGYVHARVGGGGGATVTVSQTFNLHGQIDPQTFVEQVKRSLARDTRDAMMGLMADAGMRMA